MGEIRKTESGFAQSAGLKADRENILGENLKIYERFIHFYKNPWEISTIKSKECLDIYRLSI